MTDFNRRIDTVNQERRHCPRLDFTCPVIISGVKGVHSITDLSLGGVFIELSPGSSVLNPGHKLHLIVKLPTENYSIHVRTEVKFQTRSGIGCRFLDLSEKDQESFQNCFEFYRDMLPVR